MEVRATTDSPLQTGADTICVGLVEGEGIAHDVEGAALAALVESGEAKATPRRLALVHAEGVRWLLVGLGARAELDAEGARVAAAVAEARAREPGARPLGWGRPPDGNDASAPALAGGRGPSPPPSDPFKTDPAGTDDRGA